MVEEERLLKLDARHLDPDQEIRRVFGAQVVCAYILSELILYSLL